MSIQSTATGGVTVDISEATPKTNEKYAYEISWK
jgi:hypothetical protein